MMIILDDESERPVREFLAFCAMTSHTYSIHAFLMIDGNFRLVVF
jgi:hypothetical protein